MLTKVGNYSNFSDDHIQIVDETSKFRRRFVYDRQKIVATRSIIIISFEIFSKYVLIAQGVR